MTIKAVILTGMPTITNKTHHGFRPLVTGGVDAISWDPLIGIGV